MLIFTRALTSFPFISLEADMIKQPLTSTYTYKYKRIERLVYFENSFPFMRRCFSPERIPQKRLSERTKNHTPKRTVGKEPVAFRVERVGTGTETKRLVHTPVFTYIPNYARTFTVSLVHVVTHVGRCVSLIFDLIRG